MDKQILIDRIQCAMDWLKPGRPVGAIEVENCIDELQDIIDDLKVKKPRRK